MVQKHRYTTRSGTEVHQEFLGLKAAGWHPCLLYCSTLYLPIKFRASHIDLLVSSHSYLPPLVSVKTSVAWRFITLFAFTSCFVCNWHVFAFLALVRCQHGMATPGHRLGFLLLKWVATGELLFHQWLQGVYKCVCVCRALFHHNCQTPSGCPGRLWTQSVTERQQTRVTLNAQWHHTWYMNSGETFTPDRTYLLYRPQHPEAVSFYFTLQV